MSQNIFAKQMFIQTAARVSFYAGIPPEDSALSSPIAKIGVGRNTMEIENTICSRQPWNNGLLSHLFLYVIYDCANQHFNCWWGTGIFKSRKGGTLKHSSAISYQMQF